MNSVTQLKDHHMTEEARREQLYDAIANVIGKAAIEQEEFGHTAFLNAMAELTEAMADVLDAADPKFDRARFFRKSWFTKWMGLA